MRQDNSQVYMCVYVCMYDIYILDPFTAAAAGHVTILLDGYALSQCCLKATTTTLLKAWNWVV